MTTEFMLTLHKDLKEKKEVSDSSANVYVRAMTTLNGKKPFSSLAFLKKTNVIDEVIKGYAPNTQKSLYAAIVSVLSLYKETRGFKKPYEYYLSKMKDKITEAKSKDPSEKSEKQKDNWIEWKDVLDKRNELVEKAKAIKRKPTSAEYELLLEAVVLSLYTDNAPRRNQDYLDMVVTTKKKKDDPTSFAGDKNYLLVEGKEPKMFVFNKYKTSKKYGQQIVEVSPELAAILKVYLKFHPLRGEAEHSLLVSENGEPLTAVNAITRILNRTFGKKVGSSMLRHIFISDKYNGTFDEMAATAADMAHSVSQQRDYAKKDETESSVVIPTV